MSTQNISCLHQDVRKILYEYNKCPKISNTLFHTFFGLNFIAFNAVVS